MTLLRDLASILRLHIVAIAVTATVVFTWLLHGSYRLDLAAIVGVDWLLINLLNRTTDLEEDIANAIPGTERVARHRRLLIGLCFAVMLASFIVTQLYYPALTPLRVAVQLIGTGYSLAIVPTPGGLRRFKDIYFLKNFMSAVLFVLTVFLYALATMGAPTQVPGGVMALVLLVLFFVPFELSYEVLYDLRDLEGDRLAGVPTYPVVHGPERARQIVDGLIILAAPPLLIGLALGALGMREALLLAALPLQLLFYRPRYRRGLTSRDCIALTNLGTALLLLFLVGTRVWLLCGLPGNIVWG